MNRSLVGLAEGVLAIDSSTTTPMARSPAMIGTPSHDSVSGPPIWTSPRRRCLVVVPKRSGCLSVDDHRHQTLTQRHPWLAADETAFVHVVREGDRRSRAGS